MSGAPRLVEVTDAALLESVVRLRARVWEQTGDCAPQVFSADGWRDATDDTARHWAVLVDGEPVAAARLSVHARLADVPEAEEYLRLGLSVAGPVAAPARVVVAAAHRRRGLAAMLLSAQEQGMREAGVASAVRQASPAMRASLLHRGWRDVGAARPDPMFPGVTFWVMVLEPAPPVR